MAKKIEADAHDVMDLSSESILQPENTTTPLTLTLIGGSFRTPRGEERSLRCAVSVPDGNIQAALATIRKNGGVFFGKADRRGSRWFIPWPPAAVRVSPARASASPIEQGH